MPVLGKIQYRIGDDAYLLPFEPFKSTEAQLCNNNWTYSFRLEATPQGGGKASDYLSLDSKAMKFRI